MIIGPSVGWMEPQGMKVSSAELISIGANIVEVCIKKENINLFKNMKKTLHLSSRLSPSEVFNRFNQNIVGAVFHPATLTNDEIKMYQSKFSCSVENMDKRHKVGVDIEELKQLVDKNNLGFVLDLQHAYEHDSTMEYGKKLFNALKDKITHLHVSGEAKNEIHSLVHKAENKDKIIKLLKLVFAEINVPIILEGHYQNLNDIKNEIEFIKSVLQDIY